MDHLQSMLTEDYLLFCIKVITFNLLIIPIELNPQSINLFHFMFFYLVTEKVIMNHRLQYNLIYIKLTKNSS